MSGGFQIWHDSYDKWTLQGIIGKHFQQQQLRGDELKRVWGEVWPRVCADHGWT